METWISPEEKEKLLGLNRTMQYGNSTILQNSVATGASLNRTMQYGNVDKVAYVKFKGILFKSYYVVWKLVYSYLDLP